MSSLDFDGPVLWTTQAAFEVIIDLLITRSVVGIRGLSRTRPTNTRKRRLHGDHRAEAEEPATRAITTPQSSQAAFLPALVPRSRGGRQLLSQHPLNAEGTRDDLGAPES